MCYECEETILWWLKHTCSICAHIVEHQGRAGRGIECGCNKKFYEKHFNAMTAAGNCTICHNFVNRRTSAGVCDNCLKELQSKRGMKSANKIGKLGLCSCVDCPNKGKEVMIANSNGMCQECSIRIIGEIGNKNVSKIGTKRLCPICNKVKISANVSGACKECLRK